MRFPPTNSPYLTGKTGSFHGNRIEERTRGRRRQRGGWMSGVCREELTETGKWKTCLLFFLRSAQTGGVTSAGGEAAPYPRKMWVAKRNVHLQHSGKQKGKASSLVLACLAGGYNPATTGLYFECSGKRHFINATAKQWESVYPEKTGQTLWYQDKAAAAVLSKAKLVE